MAVIITDRAKAQFDKLQAVRSGHPRIEIRAGGCNGFEKVFSWAEHAEADDHAIPTARGSIVIDPVSWDLLCDAIVDHVHDISGSSFTISIPDAISTCGCGVSFSL